MKNTLFTAVTVALLIVCFLAIRSCRINAKDLQQVTANSKQANDSVFSYWVDRFNTEHASKVVIQGDLNTVKITEGKELDEASQRLQIKDRQIEGMQRAVASVKGKFTTKVVHDSNLIFVAYRDSNFTETATVTGDNVAVDYTVKVPIYLTQYWKRPWFLGKKVHYVDGYSGNPNAHITNLQSVKITKDPGRFGIGPFIGISSDLKPAIGISLHYSLIRF